MNNIDPSLEIIKNKYCICFATDMIYLKHLGVVLESLNQNCKGHNCFDTVIFDNNLEENASKLITNKYKKLNIRFYNVSNYINNSNLLEKSHINKSTYLRYAILDILKDYDKVLYLDCDLVINADIHNIFKIDIEGYCLGAVRDTFHCYCNSPKNPLHKKENKYCKDRLELDNVYDYFNAGVTLFNVKELLKQKYTSKYLFEVTLEKQFKWLDQDTLNYLFKNKIKFLDQGWNCMVGDLIDFNNTEYDIIPTEIFNKYRIAYNNPMIIHYAGKQQPIYNEKAAFSDLYWKYAKASLFYEDLLIEQAIPKKSHKFKDFIKKHKRLYRFALRFKK